MFTLVTENNRFFRIKRGQSAAVVEKVLNTPVNGAVFAGKIIEVRKNLSVYTACVADSYRSIARKTGVSEELLRELNANKPVYPTCKIFIPNK